MAVPKIVWVATDGSLWHKEADARRRDELDAAVRVIEGSLPEPPHDSAQRVAVDPGLMALAKQSIVELCRATYPNECVFQHEAHKIHPFSYAGRFLDGVGGPLRRIWWRFMCYTDGWIYQQPYFAQNPGQFKER